MRQWGEGVIDRLDEAAVADGGGLVTALAALARTPARSFASFMQGTAGTVSLLDGRVRGEISDGLSQVMSDPGLIGRAASDYWRSRTLADMAADLYANGAAGAMMGGAGAAALGRLNRLPGLEALADAVANAKPATARLRQTGGVRIPSAAEINEVIARYGDIGARFTHVFKNPEHLLRDFVLRYGNESAAFAAIDRAAQQLAGTPGVVITRWIQVEGTPIWVRGNTVNGRFRISTFSANVDNTKYPYSP